MTHNTQEGLVEKVALWPADALFQLGELVQKKGRASWRGRVVGWYRTELTALGYAIESIYESGSVQIYPQAAITALNASPNGRVVEWQDIATAPRDERFVLLYGPEGCDLGRWDDMWGDGAWVRLSTAEYDNDGAKIETPTHWQPLPEPPLKGGDDLRDTAI